MLPCSARGARQTGLAQSGKPLPALPPFCFAARTGRDNGPSPIQKDAACVSLSCAPIWAAGRAPSSRLSRAGRPPPLSSRPRRPCAVGRAHRQRERHREPGGRTTRTYTCLLAERSGAVVAVLHIRGREARQGRGSPSTGGGSGSPSLPGLPPQSGQREACTQIRGSSRWSCPGAPSGASMSRPTRRRQARACSPAAPQCPRPPFCVHRSVTRPITASGVPSAGPAHRVRPPVRSPAQRTTNHRRNGADHRPRPEWPAPPAIVAICDRYNNRPLRLESRPQLRFDHFGFDQNTGADRLTWTDGQTETQTDRDRQTDRQTTHADTRTHTTQNACVRTHPIATKS